MKRILAIALTAAAVTLMSDGTANAQCNTSGYGFGVGINQARLGGGSLGLGGGFFGIQDVRRVEEPPYFAKFPPVYYSGIVRRPYGISPYAAPAGIAPVELSIPTPTTVKNKYFSSEISPVSKASETDSKVDTTEDKTTSTWVANPYVATVAQR